MKIFSSSQIKEWDAYTIKNEPITSIDLMERAATACCKWLIGKNFGQYHFRIFCGKGNNGGDGLAIARMLIEHRCTVTVYILEFGNIGTGDFQTNLERLHPLSSDIHFIQSEEFFPVLNDTDIIIDALFGTGPNKPLTGISKALVEHINRSNSTIISIDLPSGLFADKSSKSTAVINASITLTFQNYKLAFILPENQQHCGEVHLLHIGLHKDFEAKEESAFELIDEECIRLFGVYWGGSFFTVQDASWHQVIIRDTSFTPSHVVVFYGSFPMYIVCGVASYLYAMTRLPLYSRGTSFPLVMAIAGRLMILPNVGLNEWGHAFWFMEELFSAPLHWGFVILGWAGLFSGGIAAQIITRYSNLTDVIWNNQSKEILNNRIVP